MWKGNAAVMRMHCVLVCERSSNRLNLSAAWQVLPAVSKVRKTLLLAYPHWILILNLHTDNSSSWWGARNLPSGAFLMYLWEVKGTDNYSCLQRYFLAWLICCLRPAPWEWMWWQRRLQGQQFRVAECAVTVSVLCKHWKTQPPALHLCKALRQTQRWAGKGNLEGNIIIEMQTCTRREIIVWTEVRKWETCKYVPHNLMLKQKDSPWTVTALQTKEQTGWSSSWYRTAGVLWNSRLSGQSHLASQEPLSIWNEHWLVWSDSERLSEQEAGNACGHRAVREL